MRLTIDNFDSNGPRDYTGAIATQAALPRITRHLNRPAELALALVSTGASFVVPSAGARVVVSRADGHALFTGYLASAPAYDYLGWGLSGPVYRYTIHATGDEFILDRKRLPQRPAYVNRYAGSALIDLANSLLPGAFNTSAVENVERLNYTPNSEQPFSRHAAELALRTRSVYRAHDSALTFQPLGRTTLAIFESDATFSPDALQLTASERTVNDVAVFGNVEPQCRVKDYFLGDGFSLSYYLSHAPFAARTFTLLEEEYGAALNPSVWSVSTGNAWVGNGSLVLAGAVTASLIDPVELGGALSLQHGDFTFSNASTGIAGGLYNGAFDLAHCVAGFQLSPSGAQSRIQPIVNGAAAGTSLITQAGKHYVLVTRLFANESYRHQRAFHSSSHPAGSARGDQDITATVRVIFDVHTIDPANPGSVTTPSTILFDGYIAACPSFATYAVASGTALNASVSFTRLLRAQDAFVSSTIPGQATRTRLIGPQYEGGECHVSTTSLGFYAEQVPAPNEAIRVSYRASGKSSARITDAASIAQHANAPRNDDGVRALSSGITSPAPRTSAECELAAHALLDDRTLQSWAGEYACWSHLLPQVAALPAQDTWPGDRVSVNVPSRAAAFTASLYKVLVDLTDLSSDISRYTLFFSNDETLTSYTTDAQLAGNAAFLVPNAVYLADLPDAEITSTDSVTLYIDSGVTPLPGGGIEVRRSDTAWAAGNDRNLLGRFATRTFSLPRLARTYTVYLRQYDAAGHYSRDSTALHISYPL